MSIVTPSVRYVAESEDIKLLQPAAACCVDWKQDWECDKATDEATNDGDFQQPQEQVAVERPSSIKDVRVRNVEEGADPVEQAIG